MRRRLGFVLGASLGFAASAASAGTLTMATWSQVTQGVPMTRTLAQLNASGSSAADAISVSLSYPQTTITAFFPKTSMAVLDLHIRITQGGMQAITATPSIVAVTGSVAGTVIVKTAMHSAMGVNQSMFIEGVNTLLRVPLSHGRAGQFTTTLYLLNAAHDVTVDFYAWTHGTLTFTDLTSQGMALPDVVAMGSFFVTGRSFDRVSLVAPTRISVDGPLAQRRVVSFTKLTLAFPEPGVGPLLGAAATALWLGSARRRR